MPIKSDTLDSEADTVVIAPKGLEPKQTLQPIQPANNDDDDDEQGLKPKETATEQEEEDEQEDDEQEDDDDAPVNFSATSGPVGLLDTSTHPRWLQSALRTLVAPSLRVDGLLGPRSHKAVAKFQRRSRSFGVGSLLVDGIPGTRTTAALEAATKSMAPPKLPHSTHSTQDTPPLRTSHDRLILKTIADGDTTEYIICADDQQVSFKYWSPDRRNYKPYNVSRYKGAKKDLLTDSDIAALGYSTSDIKILQANALKESGGTYGAINTWDNQIVSWGVAQFAGSAGTLASLLAELKANERTKASFERWFVTQGINVAYGEYPWKRGKTKTGWHVVINAGNAIHRGNEGWNHLRTQPLLIGAFLLAGNDPAIQLGQLDFWHQRFLTRAINKKVIFANGQRGELRKYITSERGIAILVRLNNWMPKYVKTWSNRFIKQLEETNPGQDLSDPHNWDQRLEDMFVQKVCDERKRVKKGSYDSYALDLNTARGSYVAGPAD
ncbi:MAG: peptidoglycan-binding domain-containing protein [Myxococcota bacterium]